MKSKDGKRGRTALNTSAILANNNRGQWAGSDLLNSTAPINMTQMRMHDYENPAVSLTDAVNSTQNFKRMNSKDSQREYNGMKSSNKFCD